jgi:hypothetical protein
MKSRMQSENPRRSGSLTNLIVTFVIIAGLMLGYQVAGLISTMDFTLAETLKQTQELYSVHLAGMVDDEVASGNYDDIDATLNRCLTADGELVFAMVVGNDGKVLGATDKNVKNMVLNSNDLDKAALAATKLTRIDTDVKRGLSQIVVPLVRDSKKMGVLRAGFSNAASRRDMQRTTQTAIVASILLLVIGTSAYAIMVMRILDNLLAESATSK